MTKAIFALQAGVWFQRGRLVIVSCAARILVTFKQKPTYPDVQILRASSISSAPMRPSFSQVDPALRQMFIQILISHCLNQRRHLVVADRMTKVNGSYSA
jgi:PBP1b-binding outer membrane lipoprotein LpoB